MRLRNKDLLRNKAFIDGKWVLSKSKKCFSVFNPATEEKIQSITDTNKKDFNLAIKATKNAFEKFKDTSCYYRAELLNKWADLIDENKDDLAYLITYEQGKPLSEAKKEVESAIDIIESVAEQAKRMFGNIISSKVLENKLFVIKQPVGVVGAIIAWNGPVSIFARKAATAIAAGCTVIMKTAKDTPQTGLALSYLAQKANFPKGVLNTLPTNSPKDFAKTIIKSPHVRKLSFTGSCAVGKLLYKQCADNIKKITLELGL